MLNIASVVISNCTREFDKEYHYLIPEDLISRIYPGKRVIVPFGRGNRPREGYVLRLESETDFDELKEIQKVIDDESVLSKAAIELAMWMKERYICTYYDAFKCILPIGLGAKSQGEIKAKTVRAVYLAQSVDEIVDEIESNRIKRIQQIRVLEMLMDNEYISIPDIMRFAGVSASVLNTLKKYGYINFMDVEIKRDPYKDREFERTEALVPTPEQANAIKTITRSIDSHKFEEVLVHGVTGSGKTELYLQLIQKVILNGRQAIVLVPEISLTPQMVERFKGRFGDDVAVLHSRLSPGERYDQWRLINDDKINVVVGARSAVFAPFKRLGIVIIDEEHESSYKSEITPKYRASEIAQWRCEFHGAVLVYGSATPSIDTYYRAVNGDISLVELNSRTNKMDLPRVDIVDMRKELEEGNRSVFSSRLKQEIIKRIESGQQTMLFLNRRGHASFVLCRTCGYVIKCINCNISLTYHSFDGRLICHYCGYTIKMPKLCPKCKSTYIKHFGTGTQKVEEDIKKEIPGCSVIRMDMDTTTRKNSHEEILRTFREENINIMVGTQMIAKGHDFPNVTLVGVLAADGMLNMGDYRASERTFQLITQVAGRSGRGDIPGNVIIQTYNTEDFSIQTACNHDYASFYRQEILLREKLGYPPFVSIAVLIINGINDREVFDQAVNVKNIINSLLKKGIQDSMEILGPSRSPLAKIRNKYRWRIIIKSKDKDMLLDILKGVVDKFYGKHGKNAVELSVDINPYNML